MHFWHAPTAEHGGDLIYVQGHCSPGHLCAQLPRGPAPEERLLDFRQEVDGGGLQLLPASLADAGLLAVPDRLDGPGPADGDLPGPLPQVPARPRPRRHRARKVWAFLGDGECDEPESLGAISLGGREKLDNLVFVINCNLQRLDGPVRGNGKIIQELEGIFNGAGWNVIKVLWGSGWDQLIAADTSGILLKRMEEAVDGEYQDFKSKNGAYVREHFFGKYPELAAMVADWTDDEIWALVRGGHDPLKVYAAYHSGPAPPGPADRHPGQDRQGLRHGRGRRGPEHHPSAEEDGRSAPARVRRPLRPAAHRRADPADPVPHFGEGSPGTTYLHEPPRRRWAATCRPGGSKSAALEVPPLSAFAAQLTATGERTISHHHGVRAHPQHAPARQEDRQARGADRARRIAHLRHGGHVPPVRHLQPGGPALPAAGCRPADVLQGGQERPDPAGGDQRGRGHGVLDRGGDVLQHQRRADDPVLHLLLDVRLPAGRRPRLGRRRHARPRLPGRRHLRPDHAQRRGAAARGRPQPHPLGAPSPTASPTTRPSPTRWR